MTSTVAIIGRPNVGKSTLFNRLVGRREAIVDKTPGVTRDRREGAANIGGLEFRAIDTAGFEGGGGDSLEVRAWHQTEVALDDADLALLVIDAIAGITPADQEFVQLVRSRNAPVVLVANKCEGGGSDAGYYEAFGLGLGEPVAVSAEHNLGMGDLYDALTAHLVDPEVDEPDIEFALEADSEPEDPREGPLRLVMAGRQNVGKSTLINRLIGKNRVLAGAEPGLTRDAIPIEWETEGRAIRLIDTAGLRRRAKVTSKLERVTAADTRRGVAMAQVALLVIDGQSPMERQDLTVANMALELGRALVVVVNKWDMVTDREAMIAALRGRLADSLPQVKGVPIVTLSALTGDGVDTLMPAVYRAFELWSRRVGTGALNRWLGGILQRQPPPQVGGRTLRIRYITQASARPPTFVLFSNRPRDVPDSYIRFLLNDLREAFDLPGVPVRISLRASGRRKAT